MHKLVLFNLEQHNLWKTVTQSYILNAILCYTVFARKHQKYLATLLTLLQIIPNHTTNPFLKIVFKHEYYFHQVEWKAIGLTYCQLPRILKIHNILQDTIYFSIFFKFSIIYNSKFIWIFLVFTICVQKLMQWKTFIITTGGQYI